MIVAIIVNSTVIAIVVMVHFESLRQMSYWIPKLPKAGRSRVVVGVFGSLVTHVLEVWIFAFSFYWYVREAHRGVLTGNFDGTLLDCVYFSLTNYTSPGYGDIVPVGNVRFLAVLQGLVGLVMIGWTASFIYVEMTSQWRDRES